MIKNIILILKTVTITFLVPMFNSGLDYINNVLLKPDNLLIFLICSTFIAMFWLFFEKEDEKIKRISIMWANGLMIISLFLYVYFDVNSVEMQFIFARTWSYYLNIYYVVAIDGLSIFFVLLTTFLIVICILVSWESIQFRVKEFMIILFFIEFLLLHVFTILDLFLFYVFFEGILIPMFIMIGIWGSRQRKIHAAYQFFLYTLTGSVLMLLAIVYIYINIGSTFWGNLISAKFSFEKETLLWLAIFASLAVKIPMFPVHIWLPEAHVEAPTAGSVLLAGILLKMGGYGFLRFLLPVFPVATHYFTPVVFTLCIIGIIYSSLTTIRQIDLKKIIAYSSIGHMNFVMLGIFSGTVEGIEGSIILMVSHGIVSSGLFMCVGVLYDRYKTRVIKYYGGLSSVMPIFALFFFILTLSNIGLPGTSSFVGEFLILLGIMQVNSVAAVLSFIGMIFGAIYSIWLYNRVMFGSLQVYYINFYADLKKGSREYFMFIPILFLVFLLGVYPNFLLDLVHTSAYRLVELMTIKK